MLDLLEIKKGSWYEYRHPHMDSKAPDFAQEDLLQVRLSDGDFFWTDEIQDTPENRKDILENCVGSRPNVIIPAEKMVVLHEKYMDTKIEDLPGDKFKQIFQAVYEKDPDRHVDFGIIAKGDVKLLEGYIRIIYNHEYEEEENY